MLNYGQALRSWIYQNGNGNITDFVEDVTGLERGSREHVKFRSKLNTLLKNSRFSKQNWESLADLLPQVSKEELEEIAKESSLTDPDTHVSSHHPSPKPELNEKRLRITAAQNTELKRMLSTVNKKLDNILEKLNRDNQN